MRDRTAESAKSLDLISAAFTRRDFLTTTLMASTSLLAGCERREYSQEEILEDPAKVLGRRVDLEGELVYVGEKAFDDRSDSSTIKPDGELRILPWYHKANVYRLHVGSKTADLEVLDLLDKKEKPVIAEPEAVKGKKVTVSGYISRNYGSKVTMVLKELQSND